MLGFLKSFTSNIHYNYALQDQPQFASGAWCVYDAKHKTSGELVSVFVLTKKQIARQLQANGVDLRSDLWEQIKEFAVRGVQRLTQIRHPAVLKLVEPLETSKGHLMFAAERVIGTLDSMIKNSSVAFNLDDLSVIRGLTSVVQGLQFLHNNMGNVHLNLTPLTVFSDIQGDWKLAGLENLVKFDEFAPQSYHLPRLDMRLPSFVHPPYDYLAPELVLNKTVGPVNDVWSVACLLYVIYVRRPPLNTGGNPSDYKEEFQRFRNKLLSNTNAKFPQTLRPYVESLFCERPEGRITFEVLESTDFFQNPLIRALKSMDEYTIKTLEDKASFLKYLKTLLPQFPKQMRLRKIVSFAVQELKGTREPATATLMGDILFSVCSDISKLTFQEQVLPLFTLLVDFLPFQESVASNLDIVARATSDKDFSKTVLPLLVDILKHHDAQHVALQTQVLKSTQVYASNIVVAKMEHLIFPAIIDCFAATPARVVKTAAAESLNVLVSHGVSKTILVDRLVPALQAVKTRDPIVVVSLANLWKALCTRLNSQEIFTLALPHLLDCSLAKQLTVDQFKVFMAIIREQLQAVEKNQIKELKNNLPQNPDDWLEMEQPTLTSTSLSTQEPSNTSTKGLPVGNSSLATSGSEKTFQKPAPLPKTPFVLSPLPKPSHVVPTAVSSQSDFNASTAPLKSSSHSGSANLMESLEPSPSVKPSNASKGLMNFAPLQPVKPSGPVSQLKQAQTQGFQSQKSYQDTNDDFGAFTSSNSSKFDSLI